MAFGLATWANMWIRILKYILTIVVSEA